MLARQKLVFSQPPVEPPLCPQDIGVYPLPALHGDPFDRVLIVQALARKPTLVTGDKELADLRRAGSRRIGE
jgi:PIN domain nuclease of toxin-antitoxin system